MVSISLYLLVAPLCALVASRLLVYLFVFILLHDYLFIVCLLLTSTSYFLFYHFFRTTNVCTWLRVRFLSIAFLCLAPPPFCCLLLALKLLLSCTRCHIDSV